MKKKLNNKQGIRRSFLFIILAACILVTANSNAVTVNVVDPTGTPIGVGFRWLLEEDNTNITVPGVPVRVSISTDIHNSYAPVIAKGQVGGSSATIDTDTSGSALNL